MRFSDIKIVCVDVDGTLSDGIYQISESRGKNKGIVTKSFYTKDFYALERIMKAGIAVIIITQSHDTVINDQINRISSHSENWRYFIGSNLLQVCTCVENKKEYLHSEILKRMEWGWHNVAYMGDAENDVPSMKKALWTGCPSDAIEDVKYNSNYISDFPGGRGAVYDFCMHIIKKRKNNE